MSTNCILSPLQVIRQDYNGFSKLCHELDELVLLTRNGEADLVVMSHEAFRRMEARIKLHSKLLAAEKQVAEGEQLIEHDEVLARMQRKIDAVNKGAGDCPRSGDSGNCRRQGPESVLRTPEIQWTPTGKVSLLHISILI